MLERALIFPAWLVCRTLFLCLYYPLLAVGYAQAWLAAGIRDSRG